MTCDRCHGLGFINTCVDDLCHADGDESECMHGDMFTCPDCEGEGELSGDDWTEATT